NPIIQLPRRLLSWRRCCWPPSARQHWPDPRPTIPMELAPPCNSENCQRIPAAPGPAERDPGNLGRLAAQGYLHRVQFKLRYYLSPLPAKKHQSQHALFLLLAPFGRGYSEFETLAAIWRRRPTGAAAALPVWLAPVTRLRMSGYSPTRQLRTPSCCAGAQKPRSQIHAQPARASCGLRSGLLASRCYGNPGTGAAIWRGADGSQRPGPAAEMVGAAATGRLNAGLWSHSVLRVLPAAAIACTPARQLAATDWPAVAAAPSLPPAGLRHRDSDNGRSLA
uniref:Exostosin domain-containing protein n=1 Tax=Macrostomum lignano TaxID=282301 RepID=A0A1I8FPM5_9PLAT